MFDLSKQLIIVPDSIVFRELTGESILFDPEQGEYFGLDEIGTEIWHLLSNNNDMRDILGIMSQKYNIDKDLLSRDLVNFVAELHQAKLISICR